MVDTNNSNKNEVIKIMLNHIQTLDRRLNDVEDRLSRIEGKLSIIISLVLSLIGAIIYAIFTKI